MKSLKFAPVQGHTDAAYRHFHASQYGNEWEYFTPFIRLEKGTIRNRDIKDFKSELNDNLLLIPQIIFRDEKELNSLIKELKLQGVKSINLNLGCPFPLQTGHGRGAGAITNTQLAENIVDAVNNNPDIDFSVKMRLGYTKEDEWKSLLPYLNKINLSSVTVHPRIAKQQYSGELYMDQFKEILEESRNPIVFNGDIKKPEDINEIFDKYPGVTGVMAARGILGRPSLFNEFKEGKEWDRENRIKEMLKFHRSLFQHYSATLCGDAQIISKIKPFWEYAEEEIGRKAWKGINKSTNMATYQTAVASIS